jgi:hypothetical protein
MQSMSTNRLSIDVYVAPMRPYTCPDQLGEGEVATWAPSSSTLGPMPNGGGVRVAATQRLSWNMRLAEDVAARATA